MISTKNLTVSIDSKNLVEDITLEIPHGSLTVITGRNGAGKSTLLKAICGDLPSKGEVRYGSRVRNEIPDRTMARQRAVVSRHSNLSFDFTAREVVLMGRIPHSHGLESEKDHNIAEQCMKRVGVERFSERSFPTLSGGEKQRVRIAAALAQIWEPVQDGKPAWLLLDEPTSSQDLSQQHRLLQLLVELAGQGVTVCTIVHDLNLAAQYAGKVVILKEGRLHVSGTPHDVFTKENIEHAFDCPIHVMRHPHLGCPLIVGAVQQTLSEMRPLDTGTTG